ncbi:MAG: FxSxx-COOH system tetratricopeptide repeat protein [candidate division WOR-3 bacterium]|nr:FxSxx-COOH system tetratricopeptide repeat protein [candidate division WOR-3 bacterium]
MGNRRPRSPVYGFPSVVNAHRRKERDFFISYNHNDRDWAEWIAWQLDNAKYAVILQAWDFRPGTDFVAAMDESARLCKRTIAVISPDYPASVYTRREWAAAMSSAPGKLLPVVVRNCQLVGRLTSTIHVDLTGLGEVAARNALLKGVKRSRIKPKVAPAFPSPADRTVPSQPRYPTTLPTVWNVPYRRNSHFASRDKLIGELRTALTSGRPTSATQVIKGLGGIGKTQLAVEYAYRYAGDYTHVLWVQAEDPVARAGSFASLADILGLAEKDTRNQAVVVEAVRRWLESNNGWLLILDNAPDPASISPFLPRDTLGHVVITSRFPNWGGVAESLSVPVLPRPVAAEFLLKRTRSNDRKSAKDLANELGGLPLALGHAAAYIEDTGCTIAHYLDVFRTQREAVLKWRSDTAEYPESVAGTWNVSFQMLARKSAAGAELLNLCAFLAPEDIGLEFITQGRKFLPARLAEAAGNQVECDQAIAALQRYSLAEFHGGSISVHRLVQAVAYDRLAERERRFLASAAVEVVNCSFPDMSEDVRTWAVCSRLLPHALSAADHAVAVGSASRALGRLLGQAGLYLHGRAQYPGAEALMQRSLKIRKKMFGPEHPDVAESLNNLGTTYAFQGRHAKAEPLLRRALSIWEKTLGPEDPNAQSALNSLAGVCMALGKRSEAGPLLQRSLEIRERILPPDDPALAPTLNNLGGFYLLQREYAKAEPLFRRALDVRRKAFGPKHPDVAASINNLATLYTRQGRYAEAVQLYQRSLNVWKKTLGPEHPHVGSALNSLAAVHMYQGKNAKAEPLLQRALKIRTKALGADNPFVAESLSNLATLYTRQGRYAKAEPLFQKVLRIREKAFGSAHPDVAASLDSLAELFRTQGRYAEAEPLLKRAVEIARKSLGPEHPNTKKVAADLQAMQQEMAKMDPGKQ